MTYYFTYGVGLVEDTHQAYSGGWTEVSAPTREMAIALYKVCHPLNDRGLLPCCSVAFTKDEMGDMLETGNPGAGGYGCHDRIVLHHSIF